MGFVLASDADGDVNGDLTFDIVGFNPPKGQDLFAITKASKVTASITLKGDLTNEWGDYKLKVMVSSYSFKKLLR